MFLLLLSFILPLLLGFLVIAFLLKEQGGLESHLLFKSSLAVGFGLGFSSCIFFVWLVIMGSPKTSFVKTDIALIIALSLILLYGIKQRHRAAGPESISQSEMKWRYDSLLLVSLCIVLVLAIAVFLMKSLNSPHGTQDAWLMWNFKAKFLFGRGDKWRDMFSIAYHVSPDYPLLIPGSVARAWSYIGNEAVAAPVLIAMLFTFGTIGLTVSSLSLLRSKRQGLIGGLVLLSFSLFISRGASQCADIPLSFFILAVLVLFCLKERVSQGGLQIVFLAGMMTGFAAWTKNEGLLFFASVIIARFFVIFPRRGWKAYLEETLFFMAGTLPALIILAYFKTQLAPPSIYAQGIQPIIHKLTDF